MVLIEDGIDIHISVHFIDQRSHSASIFIPLIDEDYDVNNPMDFYKQAGKRNQKYRKWLKRHMILSSVKLPHSLVLFGEKKSAHTFIVIHWAGF